MFSYIRFFRYFSRTRSEGRLAGVKGPDHTRFETCGSGNGSGNGSGEEGLDLGRRGLS